jgi:hypothetical protein
MRGSISGLRRVLAIGGAALVAACSGGGGSGTSGGGGQGTSSTSSTTSGGGTCAGCIPQCYIDAFANCMPTGACTQQGTGTTVNACYASGVKISTMVGTSGATGTVYKADGSVCLTTSSVFSSTSVTATWKDPSGNVVFVDQAPLTGGPEQVTCGGKTYTFDPSSPNCKTCNMQMGQGSSCTMGTCAVP